MAENSQSSPMDDTLSTTITTSATHIDIENPYYLHSFDGTGTSLVGTPLVGIDNYTSWALAMTMALRGRNKFCFVDGTLAMPDVSHPDHARWQRVNNIVMSWILNSIHPSLAHTVLYAPDAATVCLWDELNLLDPPPKCSCSARTAYVTQTERMRLFQFFMGLRETYSQARSQLLLNSVLPTVKGAYALLLQDEKQRTLDHLGTSTDVAALQATTQNSNMSANFQHDFHNLTGTSFTPPMPNNFQTPVIPQQATTQFASQQHPFHMLPNNSHANVATQPRFGNNRSKPRCTHCGILAHTQQVCYKLHGYPPGHKYFKKGNTAGNPPTVPPSPSNSSEPITTETIQQLLRLLRVVK
nr:Retrovirus-related Pol polyprotein from transposon RE1 [Ipomoea batatas]